MIFSSDDGDDNIKAFCEAHGLKDREPEWVIKIQVPSGGFVRRHIPLRYSGEGYGNNVLEHLQQEARDLAVLAVTEEAQRQIMLEHGIDPDGEQARDMRRREYDYKAQNG